MNKTARVELANQVPENSSREQSLLFAVTVRKKVFFMLTAIACCIYEHYTQEHYTQKHYYRKNCLAAKSLSIALQAPVDKVRNKNKTHPACLVLPIKCEELLVLSF